MSKSEWPPADAEKSKSPGLLITDTAGQFRITRRDFVKGTAGTVLALTWFGAFPANILKKFGGPKSESPTAWWFVHGSDSHTNTTNATDSMATFLNDVHQTLPQAEFVVDTGDITDHGWEEELDRNRQSIAEFDKPVYAIMGNHDARWSRSGRRAFRNRYGATHWVIERDNLAVILIDGAVLLEQYGHIDPAELAWLELQLKKLKGKAALVGVHHPPCEADQFLDSDHALFGLLSRYNVLAILAGHIHTRKAYQVNGIEIVTSGGVVSPRAVYCAWEITPKEVVLHERDPVRNEIRKVLSIPLNARKRGVDLSPLPELNARRGFGRWHITAEHPLWSPGVQLLLNGVVLDETALVSRRAKRLKLDLNARPPGHYELAAVSPRLAVPEMQWRWGEIYRKPDNHVKLCWEIDLLAGIQCKPAFYKDLIITGTNDGTLRALKSASGEPVWQYSSGPDAVLSNPLVNHDRLYFGSIGERVVCLNPASGKEIWSTPVAGSVIASARMAGENLVVGTGKGWMLALDPEAGKTRWSYRVGGLIKATPAFDGTNLYFGAWDGNFYAVNAQSGAEVWVRHMTTPHLSPATCNPGLLDGRIVVVTHDYATHCLDAATGKELWKFPRGYEHFDWQSPLIAKCKPSYSSPVFYKGVAYLTSITGHVVGLEVATGEQKMSLDVGEEIFDSFPVLVDHQFYFGTLRGRFTGVNLDTGKISRVYSLGPAFIFSPPAAGKGVIAIGNMAGRLTCFEE